MGCLQDPAKLSTDVNCVSKSISCGEHLQVSQDTGLRNDSSETPDPGSQGPPASLSPLPASLCVLTAPSDLWQLHLAWSRGTCVLSELKQQLLSRLFDLQLYACTNPGSLGRANSLLLMHCVI